MRLAAVQVLRESKYPDAIGPMAALVNDPVDQIQLEAIGAELSFFLVEEVPSKKRVALFVEVRNPGRAPLAFELGPLAVSARTVPPELVDALLKAVDDENPKVRLEAIYTLGTIASPPLPDPAAAQLVKALDHLRSGCPGGRRPSRRAARGEERRRQLDQGAERFAGSRAVRGNARAWSYARTPGGPRALTEQFNYYGKGEGAWSALDALAHLADPSSVPLFKAHLADKDPFLRRGSAEGLGRAGDTSEVSALEIGAGNDAAEMVRAAMAFALQKVGRNYLPRLVESMESEKMSAQVAGIFDRARTSGRGARCCRTCRIPARAIRGNVATVLGAIGGAADALSALQPPTEGQRSCGRAGGHPGHRAPESPPTTMPERIEFSIETLDTRSCLIKPIPVPKSERALASEPRDRRAQRRRARRKTA